MESTKKKVLKALQELITTRESIRKAESSNKRNVLFGVSWTLTQFHIVALLKEHGMNNTNLAKELNVSKPAVTKAIKKLLEHRIIDERQNERNKKEIFYVLTEKGEIMASIHDRLHKEAEDQYLSLLNSFTKEQLETIIIFLNTLTSHLKDEVLK
ncbi:MarR family transcriptional regulator [Aneurinibacillus thermoaerophilus]|uniref:MarR family transcriptional regulator n=1 Tax=Aneurinibacillus thermoaerophilus TaxID=143495 RepID=UPI002E1A7C1C|nr:MarR family transcriptional regulator [Aneurinibacillus thermoaerophilus]MED0679224.1 MarR family transcriptional regulator [Aneurinibacillus thermoaerophilus]MED0764837.1 MarR family transcriptional regulator [Aneurinibacillus thermoaerophilus]